MVSLKEYLDCLSKQNYISVYKKHDFDNVKAFNVGEFIDNNPELLENFYVCEDSIHAWIGKVKDIISPDSLYRGRLGANDYITYITFEIDNISDKNYLKIS